MTHPTSLIWFRRLLVLGAVVAGATASAAGAVGRPPDVQDTADANLAALISRPPDVRDAASAVSGPTTLGLAADGLRLQGIAQAYESASRAQGLKADGLRWQAIAQAYQEGRQAPVPDVFERYAAAHPYGAGPSAIGTAPDLRDEAALSHLYDHRSSAGSSSQTTQVSRPPDVRDAALALQYRPADEPSGFQWGDWAIGIGTGLGLAIFVGAGLVVTRRQLHHRTQTV